jgi:hypothetical protein
MEEFEEIRISKDTQKFVKYLSDLHPDKARKVITLISALRDQQFAEKGLENARGWRYMWQRTPKPYLLMLAYFVFFGAVGGFGYQAISKSPTTLTQNSIILLAIVLIPLILVFYISYQYVKNEKLHEKDIE